MSELGAKVQAEIESKLQGFIEEEELSAMIDVAIPKIRESLQAKVAANVQSLAEKRLDPFFEHYSESERFEKHAEKIAEALVQQTVKCYFEDAEDIANGQDPRHGYYENADSHYNSSKKMVSKLGEIVESKIVRRLAEKIEGLIDEILNKPKLNEKADAVLGAMLPRAASAFLESSAFAMIRSFTNAISNGRQVNVELTQPMGGSCPSCSTSIKNCPKCGLLRRSGDSCCGTHIPY